MCELCLGLLSVEEEKSTQIYIWGGRMDDEKKSNAFLIWSDILKYR
jgi:hypothetical protein